MPAIDVLIIGSGLAGQAAALRLAPTHRVALVSKRSLEDSASSWAQGGIAAVFERGQPTPAFEQLDPNERLFAEAWAVAGQPKSRIGDGLKWDTPGFDPP